MQLYKIKMIKVILLSDKVDEFLNCYLIYNKRRHVLPGFPEAQEDPRDPLDPEIFSFSIWSNCLLSNTLYL